MGIFNRKKVDNPNNFETVINKYGEIMEKVSQDAICKYPANVFPKSLLPFPQEQIENALNQAIQQCNDKAMIEQLRIGLVILRDFIEDEEATRKNQQILEAYAKAKEYISKDNKRQNI